ncbi:MAG TPA: RIP metalloprotease RseP [Alphaproteobacteria bacterium]|nr:RIP metalloprotease RseP [Alphaproteobacteria bacterium]
MEFISSFGWHALWFLVVLTVLVFVHELGHYWVARRNGVRVDVFSIGFGPELFGWTDRAGTRWKVSAIPLGGYVKMFGDADPASSPDPNLATMSENERAVSFHHKRLGQRAAVVAAGPIANFLFAIVVFAGVYSIIGQPFTSPEVVSVVSDSAAERAGLMAGDRIIRINGVDVERFEQIQRIVQLNLDHPLELTVRRNDQIVSLTAVPTIEEKADARGNLVRTPRLGIEGRKVEFVQHGPLEAIWRGMAETWIQTAGTLQALGQMVLGKRQADDLGGPLRIGEMAGDVARGGPGSLLIFMAVLSVNLGLINLFPVPMLDGGHLLFYVIEALRGRPLGPRAQEYGFRIGLVLVFSLMLFATWNDLGRLAVVKYLVSLVS